MLTEISSAVKSLFDSLSDFFSFAKTEKEHQSESEVIKDKKRLKKASDVAEDILILAVKYKKVMTPKDQRALLRYLKEFKKSN